MYEFPARIEIAPELRRVAARRGCRILFFGA